MFHSSKFCRGHYKCYFFLLRTYCTTQDIINSEMGYMGWYDAESYGLSWKVRGLCVDL